MKESDQIFELKNIPIEKLDVKNDVKNDVRNYVKKDVKNGVKTRSKIGIVFYVIFDVLFFFKKPYISCYIFVTPLRNAHSTLK